MNVLSPRSYHVLHMIYLGLRQLLAVMENNWENNWLHWLLRVLKLIEILESHWQCKSSLLLYFSIGSRLGGCQRHILLCTFCRNLWMRWPVEHRNFSLSFLHTISGISLSKNGSFSLTRFCFPLTRNLRLYWNILRLTFSEFWISDI